MIAGIGLKRARAILENRYAPAVSRHSPAAPHPSVGSHRNKAQDRQNIMPSTYITSPQHRVLVRSRIAQKIFGTDEVLVAAKQLCQLDGIDIALDLGAVTYVHFLFDAHQVVFSNGAETESFLPVPRR